MTWTRAHIHRHILTVHILTVQSFRMLLAWIVQGDDLNLDLPGGYLGKQSFQGAKQHAVPGGAHKGKRKDDDLGGPL